MPVQNQTNPITSLLALAALIPMLRQGVGDIFSFLPQRTNMAQRPQFPNLPNVPGLRTQTPQRPQRPEELPSVADILLSGAGYKRKSPGAVSPGPGASTPKPRTPTNLPRPEILIGTLENERRRRLQPTNLPLT